MSYLYLLHAWQSSINYFFVFFQSGKSPVVVYENADLDSAVESVVDAIWFNQGHVCSAGSKLLVQVHKEIFFITIINFTFSTSFER